jgi:hypothetical protein
VDYGGGGGGGGISFDNVTSQVNPNPSGNTNTLAHTIADGSNRMVIIATSHESTVAVSSVTYDGAAGTLVGVKEVEANQRIEMWRIMEADISGSGAKDAVVTWASAPNGPSIAVISFDGVAQQAEEATNSSNCLDCTTSSTNLTTLSDGALVVTNVGAGSTGSFTGHGTDQQERWDENPNSARHSGTTRIVATAGLVTLSETASAQMNRQAHFVAAFAPATASSSPSLWPLEITLTDPNDSGNTVSMRTKVYMRNLPPT